MKAPKPISRSPALRSVLQAVGKPRYVHLSSTIPVAYQREKAWGNLVRPGHAIYGYVSPARKGPANQLHVKPALDLEGNCLIRQGFRSWSSSRLRRHLQNDQAYPHCDSGGRLCRRNPASSFEPRKSDRQRQARSHHWSRFDGPDDHRIRSICRLADAVTILGPGNDAQEIARVAGTISYSVLCGISARVKRVFVD